MLLGLRQPGEQVPPVVDQCHEAGGEAAAGEVVGGEAAPAPLVLQLVEDVLAIGSVAVELAEAEDGLAERGYERGMLVDLASVREGAVPKVVGIW